MALAQEIFGDMNWLLFSPRRSKAGGHKIVICFPIKKHALQKSNMGMDKEIS